MVVVPAVAHNPARAQDSESGANAPRRCWARRRRVGDRGGPRHWRGRAGAENQAQGKASPGAQRGGRAGQFFGGPAEANHKYQTGLSIMPGSGVPADRAVQGWPELRRLIGHPEQARVRPQRSLLPRFPALFRRGCARRISSRTFASACRPIPPSQDGHQFALAPGLRFWLDQDVALKFYTTLQFVFDYMDYQEHWPEEQRLRRAQRQRTDVRPHP